LLKEKPETSFERRKRRDAGKGRFTDRIQNRGIPKHEKRGNNQLKRGGKGGLPLSSPETRKNGLSEDFISTFLGEYRTCNKISGKIDNKWGEHSER